MANRGKNFPASPNRLSDRDILMDLLITEKYMSHLYDHAIMEASGDKVRDTFIALQQDEHESAQMLFDFMQQRGWYTTGAGRQNAGRRLQSGQRLSGGPTPAANSRYAVTSGPRNFGQAMNQGRGQGDRQPITWQPQGGQRQKQDGWQSLGDKNSKVETGRPMARAGQGRGKAFAGRPDRDRNF